ncbi:MAG: hypothetical protein HFG22_14565 [Lachnospiraceae bacterium]|nr:hypothetical protein [Lachnospiraceae bacterium]
MKCCIIKDLLPSYIEGLTSEEANVEIRAHLEGCADCRRAYELMSADIPQTPKMAGRRVDLLKSLRRRLWEQYAVVALLTCALLVGLVVLLKNVRTPIPYDPSCMTTEVYQAAPVVHRFGTTQWEDVGSLAHTTHQAADPTPQVTDPLPQATNPPPQVTDPLSKATDPLSQATDSPSQATDPLSQATDPHSQATDPHSQATDPHSQATDPHSQATDPPPQDTISLVRLVVTQPAQWDDLSSSGRTIWRDGEAVRLVYYCYTRTLWDRLFPAHLNRMTSTGDIYGQRLWMAEYTPMWTEIYYLPVDSRRMEKLSDSAFDALKEDGILVWQGMD